MTERGSRTDEFLAAMRAIWYGGRPEFHGRHVSFSGVQARPRPGPVPIVVGGHTPAAYRRTIQQGNGWYGFRLSLDQTAACLAGLREAAERYERPAALGPLEVSVSPRGTPDRDAAARYAELGVHRLILVPRPDLDEAGLAEHVSRTAETLIGP